MWIVRESADWRSQHGLLVLPPLPTGTIKRKGPQRLPGGVASVTGA